MKITFKEKINGDIFSDSFEIDDTATEEEIQLIKEERIQAWKNRPKSVIVENLPMDLPE